MKFVFAVAIFSLSMGPISSAQVSISTRDGLSVEIDSIAIDGRSLTATKSGHDSTLSLEDVAFIDWPMKRNVNGPDQVDLGSPTGIPDVLRGVVVDSGHEGQLRLHDDETFYDIPFGMIQVLRHGTAPDGVHAPDARPREFALLQARGDGEDSPPREFFANVVETTHSGIGFRINGKATDDMLPWDQVYRVDFPTAPAAAVQPPICATIETVNGSQVACDVVSLDGRHCVVETFHRVDGRPWRLDIPATSVRAIRFRRPWAVPLGTLEPKLLDTWHFAVESIGEAHGADSKWIRRDARFIDSGPIAIGRNSYANGLSTRGHVEIEVRLDDHYTRFVSDVGLDPTVDSMKNADPALVFTLKGDGKELWKSAAIRKNGKPVRIDVGVEGVKVLTLVTTNEEYTDEGVLGAWGEPVLIRK